MVEFVDASVLDLVNVTRFIHYIKPSTKDMLVFAIEKYQPMDQSIVFHMKKRDPGADDDTQLLILSSEYVHSHPYWGNA